MNIKSVLQKKLLVTSLGLSLVGLVGCGGSNNHHSSSSASSSSNSSSEESMSSSDASSSSASGWELVWSDDFDGDTIDSEKWSFEKNCTGGGNNELQCYTDSADNAYVSDGMLHIVAKKETVSGPGKSNDEEGYDPTDTSQTRDYSSARLRTKNKGDWKYGRVEVRAKLPQGQGMWPAIWMLPTDWKYGGWPLSGEIDIMEAVNSNAAGGNKVYGTLHYGRSWPNNLSTGTSTTPEANVWEDYHVYALEWEQGEMRWYVDGKEYASQTSAGWFTYYFKDSTEGFQVGADDAPFNEKFHLLLNLAVGGQWPGNPDDTTSFPQEMDVDYVHVYQCSKDMETGKGCASDIDPEITPLPGNAAPEQKTMALFSDDGAATFTFNVNDTEVTNTLVPAFYDGGSSGNVVSDPAQTDPDTNTAVWDLMFNAAPGNAFLTSGNMDSVSGVDTGLKFTSMDTTGEFKFDIKIVDKEAATKLAIKLDSGWPNLSLKYLPEMTAGEWHTVAIPFSDLQPNDIQAGQVDMTKIINPFVIEPSGGTAHVQLRNIAVDCLAPCSVDPVLAGVSQVLDSSFNIFTDGAIDPNWDFGLGKWDNDSGHVTATLVDDSERGHKVVDVQFSNSTSDNGLAYIQSTTKKDASAFAASGYLQFDIKVISYGSNTKGLVVKAESGPSTGSGDYTIHPTEGSWETVTVTIADMLALTPEQAGPLDLSAFNTPFVILPVWGDQAGVHFVVDNIRWVNPT